MGQDGWRHERDDGRWHTAESRWIPHPGNGDDGWADMSHTHGALERRSPGDVYYADAPDRRRPVRREWANRVDEPERTNHLGAILATVGWYVVPIMAYLGWAFFLTDTARAGCFTADGVVCPAPRTEALRNLVDNVPQVSIAMALSITVAMLLGWGTAGWRAFTIGFSAAVVGAGVATVLFSVLAS